MARLFLRRVSDGDLFPNLPALAKRPDMELVDLDKNPEYAPGRKEKPRKRGRPKGTKNKMKESSDLTIKATGEVIKGEPAASVPGALDDLLEGLSDGQANS